MQRELYICHTPYQVLVDLCRAMQSEQRPELILSCTVPDAPILADRLLQTGQFAAVRCFDEVSCGNALLPKGLATLLLQRWRGRRNVEKHYGFMIDPACYSRVYIHNDWSVLGRYLQDCSIPYILCEDTLASTCVREQTHVDRQAADPWFRLRRVFGYGYLYWGAWKKVQAIETENFASCRLSSSKLIEHSKQAMFQSLTVEQKALIRRVFITQPLPDAAQNATLFLPRDFVADGLLDMDTQQKMFLAVANQYCCNGPLFIKAHPRDTTDYSLLFPQAIVLDRTMPSEVLNFALSFRFAKAVTVESTVLNGLLVADEKLELSLKEALALL